MAGVAGTILAFAKAMGEFGATKVYVAGDEAMMSAPVAPKAEVLAQLVAEKSPTAVLVASTAEGKEVAARLAVKSESGVITDAVDVSADLVATQSVFGGSTVVHSKVTQGTPIFTVRGSEKYSATWRRFISGCSTSQFHTASASETVR